MVRRLLALLLAAAVGTGCGGDAQKPERDRSQKVAPVLGPGRLVSVGGGRSLYLDCTGSGTPTVVLEAGFGGDRLSWVSVQPELARTTRTCAYDRAGLGGSLPMPGVHDAADEINDLQRLLDGARIGGPLVLVGHSYGGLLVRLFAHAHPSETVGVVLVESMGQDQDRRFLPIWQAAPARVRRVLPKPGASPVEDGVDLRASQALATKISTLSDTPLAVITRGRSEDDGLPPLPANVRAPIDRLWLTMQDELAALSTDHLHVVALRSGHFVQDVDFGQPDVVIAAVRAVVEAARTRTPLPPCSHVVTGPGVRCRS